MFGSITSLNIYFVPHIIERGINPLSASQAFGVVGLMSAVGSFLFGFVSDRIGRRPTIVISSAMIAALALILTSIPPILTLLYVWGVAYGIAYGGVPEQYAATIVDYFGRRYSTSIFGFLTLFGAMGGGLFPLISGIIRDLTGAYHATILFLAVGASLMTMTILPATPPSREQSRERETETPSSIG
jgi:MFS family permease